MSAYEQKIEPPDRKWQYLLFAAEPYETIAFKVRVARGAVLFTGWCDGCRLLEVVSISRNVGLVLEKD